MKMVFMFKCEKCGKLHETEDDALKCESGHLNLTVDEYHKYLKLQEAVTNAAYRIYYTRNTVTDSEFDKACKDLDNFIAKHNIHERTYI